MNIAVITENEKDLIHWDNVVSLAFPKSMVQRIVWTPFLPLEPINEMDIILIVTKRYTEEVCDLPTFLNLPEVPILCAIENLEFLQKYPACIQSFQAVVDEHISIDNLKEAIRLILSGGKYVQATAALK